MKTTFSKRGFTLIELMIVVAVIAILTAIALPSYLEHVRKARRVEGKSALLDLQTRQERYFSIQNKYTATGGQLGYATDFPVQVNTNGQASYQLDKPTLSSSATAYSATASRVNAQKGDACGDYKINQLGEQLLDNATRTDCW